MGSGKGDRQDRASDRRALDRATDATTHSGPAAVAMNLIERLLDTGIDGKRPLDGAQQIADKALAACGGDVDAAIERVVRNHLIAAGAGGFITGLGGFVTLAVALPVNVVEFYLVATRMTAAVAALRGYDVRQDNIRTAVLLTLVGADATDLLKKAGVPTTAGRITNLAAQRLPGPALMVLNKAIGFRLISQLGRSTLARLGRGIPFAGGAISAGLDTYLLKQIADGARSEFPTVVAGHLAEPDPPVDR